MTPFFFILFPLSKIKNIFTFYFNIELDNDIFFLNFSEKQKLIYLLNPASMRHVRVIGFYLKRSLELRTEVLLQHK
jgi:hypothetical protein